MNQERIHNNNISLQAVPPHMTRSKRDAEDYEEESNNIWDDDRAPVGTGLQARRTKRQRNTCRRRPLYIDFSEIHYDTWIVAPDGYEVSVNMDASGEYYRPWAKENYPSQRLGQQLSVVVVFKQRICCGHDGLITRFSLVAHNRILDWSSSR